MVDSRAFIYLPRWVRVAAVTFLAATVLFGIGFAAFLAYSDRPTGRDYTNVIIICMSLVQTALSAMAIGWFLLYSERDLSTAALQRRTEEFLIEHMPEVLKRVTPTYDLRETATSVQVLGRADIFGAGYALENGGSRMTLWVGLNVSRLIVIYWIAANETLTRGMAEEIFKYTFGGASKVGFDVFYEEARTSGGESIVSDWATVKASENLLAMPAERLFWMQDIAMMTESFWRTALRHSVTFARAEPSPL